MKHLRSLLATLAITSVSVLAAGCAADTGDDENDEMGEMGSLETPMLQSEGTIGLCDMDTYIGSGSCVTGCSRGNSCGVNKWSWSCTGYNYEHWKNYPQQNNFYYRLSGTKAYTFCQGSDPSTCPGFCN
jgi:hypothetical protein